MKKGLFIRNFLLGSLTMLLLVGGIFIDGGSQAKAATATSKVPITAYLKGYSTVKTYNKINGKVTGSIFSSDKCTILNVYSSGWCRVRYPISHGTKTAYTYTSYFFVNANFSTSTLKSGKNMTVYGKPNLTYKLGTTYANDSVLVIGSLNGKQQILYPVSGGGYKMGFISGSIGAVTASANQANSGGYSSIVYNASKPEIESMCFDAKYYADSYPDLKAAFGYDAAKLLNHWKTCGIKEGRGASPILELTYYMANNEDLRKAFGSKNYTRGYQHFLEYGYAEYRPSSKYYNGDYYRRNNADLKSFDGKFLLQHYLNNGIKESRYANTVRYMPSNTAVVASGIDFSALKLKYPNYSKWNGNYKNKAWQCHGFAVTLGDAITKTDPYNWRRVYNLNSLKAGDIVVFKRPHTIMVTGVSGNTITYVDCNWVAKNTVKWDQKIARSNMVSKFGCLKYVMVCPK